MLASMFLMWMLAQVVVSAANPTASRSFKPAEYDSSTSTVDVCITISGTGDVILGFTEVLPSGWTFESIVNDSNCNHRVKKGNLDLYWWDPITLPYSVTYRLKAPENPSGDYTWSGVMIWAVGAENQNEDPVGGSQVLKQKTEDPDPEPPVITKQPKSQTVNEGSSATFSVTATGTAPLSYQWYKGSSKISGATKSSYTISSVKSSDAGNYTVTVSNSAGSVTSDIAKLTVTPILVPPEITEQPKKSQTVNEGSSATFSVTATGTTPLSYQWKKDGQDISGATDATYTVSSVKSSDAGSYTVTVSNSAGSVTSDIAELTVIVKPVIKTQPKSQTVNEGSSVTFSVAATGTAPLSYQWYKGSSKISGATKSYYTISSVKSSDEGNYKVIVTNAAGSATSSVAKLTVTPIPVPPEITEQPKSQTVKSGSSVTFSVTATGTAPLNYQWYKGSNKISGATNATYTITSVKSSDAGNYTVTVSNSAGSATSDIAKLTVDDWSIRIDGSSSVYVGLTANYTCTVTYSNGTTNMVTPKWSVSPTNYASITTNGVLTGIAEGDVILTAYHTEGEVTKAVTKNVTIKGPISPYIITQPVSKTVNEGDSVTFVVSAGGTAPLKYQWKKNGAAISGATKSTYTISSAKSSDAGNYTVTVSNSIGSATSSVAKLTVKSEIIITKQPQSQTVNEGNSATFSVTATGTAPLSYQWKKDGQDISGATDATYTVSSVKSSDAGSYTVTVSNSAGSVTSDIAELTVIVKPVIKTQPKSQTVNEGSSVTFSVTATGTAPLKYQWYKDESAITNATNSTYTISSVKSSDVGSYTVTVSNSAGSVTSSVARLLLPVPDKRLDHIIIIPNGTVVYVGKTMNCICKAYYTDGTNSSVKPEWAIISGKDYATIDENGLLTALAEGDVKIGASYTENDITCEDTVDVKIMRLIPPEIIIPPVSQTVSVGDSVTFSVVAIGSAPLYYQWYKDGHTLPGGKSSSYTISSVSKEDAGTYTVIVTNNAGMATAQAQLEVSDKPIITEQPQSQKVNEGSSVSFSVKAEGTAPLSYQWYKGSSKISGATKATYTISSVTSSDAGSYKVTVTNKVGSVTSDIAKLTVVIKPKITKQPQQNQTVIEGSSATFSVTATGTTPLSYQWYKDGSALKNATNATYTISSVKSSDAGSYTVTASNSAGSVTSSEAQLIVIKPGSIIRIIPIENGTKVRIEFTGMLQESTDMKTWKDVTSKSPYTTGVWGEKKFYRSCREVNIDPLAIVPIANSTKVMITFTGMLQESTDMKTWKDITDKSPYTTGIWKGKRFYRSYSGASVKSAASNDFTIPLSDSVDLDMLLIEPDAPINNEVSN